MKQCSSCGGFCGKVCQRKNEDDDIQVYQRPWVGLTDEEIRQMCGSVPSMKEVVREAEAKLKEKNSG